jgi:acetyl esterase/lipase
MVRLMAPHPLPADPAKIIQVTRKSWGLPAPIAAALSRGVRIGEIKDPVRGEWVVAGSKTNVVLYFHGGGYVACSPRTHRSITAALARRLDARAFGLDYRLAPEHPFPAALDDALQAYQWLLSQGISPGAIALAGDSAGGGMVLATLLRTREAGLPYPGCGVCFSPWTDMLGSGPSLLGNAATDFLLQPEDVPRFARLYLGKADPRDPLASPLYADLRGLPPLLVQVSESEILLDDTRAIHRRCQLAGIASTLSTYPGMPHVWQLLGSWVPETNAALGEAADFIRRHLRP